MQKMVESKKNSVMNGIFSFTGILIYSCTSLPGQINYLQNMEAI